MLKRLASVLLCVTMLFAMSAVCANVSAARADSATFTISSTNAEVGEKVYVSVTLSADSYFTNATLYLHYNTTALKYVEDSFAPGYISPSSAMAMAADHADKGFVKAAYVSPRSIKKGGELLLFEFTVIKKIPAEFSLSFDECVGVDENNKDFDVKYSVVGSTTNADSAVVVPTTPTTKNPNVTTTSPNISLPTNGETVPSDTTTTVSGDTTPSSSNGGQTAVTTTTPISGEVITTVPTGATTTARPTQVVIVTDAAGETVGTSIVYKDDAKGETEPVDDSSDSAMLWIVIAVGVVLVAVAIVAVVLFVLKKKKPTA